MLLGLFGGAPRRPERVPLGSGCRLCFRSRSVQILRRARPDPPSASRNRISAVDSSDHTGRWGGGRSVSVRDIRTLFEGSPTGLPPDTLAPYLQHVAPEDDVPGVDVLDIAIGEECLDHRFWVFGRFREVAADDVPGRVIAPENLLPAPELIRVPVGPRVAGATSGVDEDRSGLGIWARLAEGAVSDEEHGFAGFGIAQAATEGLAAFRRPGGETQLPPSSIPELLMASRRSGDKASTWKTADLVNGVVVIVIKSSYPPGL